MPKYYITTTLPYVNSDPHIGFALEIIQADTLARFHALSGHEVLFNTGTDEHGQKIFEKAATEGKDTQAYVDEYAARFDNLKDALNLTYTNFIRTSNADHKKAAQEFWNRCLSSGDIYKDRYQTKYCIGCELEKQDSELEEGKCPVHPNMELELRDEENYFFAFSKYQKPLQELYAAQPDFVVPEYRFNEIKNFVDAGLRDFSISRMKEKMPWGVSVPGDEDHVMYVWFDALVNYVSTLGWPDESGDFKFWPGVQVAGKDNLRQQTAMWQAMLMSAGLKPSTQVFIHGFITSDGKKMSKSLGNVVDPFELVKEFGTDAVRYYLLREIPSHDDGDFAMPRMEERYAELANQLGNLVSRVAAMSDKYFDGKLDKIEKNWGELKTQLEISMKDYDFKKYIDLVFEIVSESNELIEIKAPFKLVKEDEAAAKEVLSELAENIRFIGQSLKPIIPEAADEIIKRYDGDKILTGDPLFPRRDN
ncbi:methionine--tRNA ligase [Candidatus Uhrbacteria bacterium]|jgi:methionyl-tRNA synthetase|nr:methionine--tRNA ligase [Candidatus Uhrbacteria bacterium]MBT7717465.1 methionine--tRNA ligase [Candidatus Uhrbacteria bacterium]